MSRDYGKYVVPLAFLEYGGPVVASVYWLFMGLCICRLVKAADSFTIKLILGLSSAMLAMAGLFWMDYYVDFPLWLYGVLEFWHSVLEVSILERLASSWLTIYKRYASQCKGLATYSKTIQRASLAASIGFQITFAVMFGMVYSTDSSLLRSLCRGYFVAAEMFYFVPYLLYSGSKLEGVIKQYIDLAYSRRLRRMAVVIVVSIVCRAAILLYYCVRNGNDIQSLDDSGYQWVTLIFCILMSVVDVGCLFAIFSVILRRVSKSEDKPSFYLKSLVNGKLLSRGLSDAYSDANTN